MFSDAVDREAAWLCSAGDGLPALCKADGGPFAILQPRFPRIPATAKTALYVLRSPGASYRLERFAAIRTMPMTEFMLRLFWPMSNGQGSGETEQLNFEVAIDAVLTRIMGFPGDKSHGGRFMAVGEPAITVNYDDVEQAMQNRMFRASITYSADDMEMTN